MSIGNEPSGTGRWLLAAALAAGVLIALSVPPFGFWPLGLVGTAVFAGLVWDRSWRSRAAVGFGVGFAGAVTPPY